jgi:PAS domain S-box-containing protein
MVLDRQLRYVEVNAAYEAATFRTREALIGGHLFELFPDPENSERVRGALQRVFDTGEPDTLAFIPYDIRTGDGMERRYWTAVHTPLRDASGGVAFVMQNTVDVTERVRTEEHRKRLLDELNHRVKNTLATVQSIAAQTVRATPDPVAFRTAFEARLMALSGVHNVLTSANWEGARLEELLRLELGPYGAARSSLEGPAVRLSAQEALTFALVTHELATNAARYGALSVPEGRVAVAWSETRDDVGARRLTLDWRETGGPTVVAPTRQGFGSRLIQRSIQVDMKGETTMAFEPDGLRCRIALRLGGD